MAHRLCKAEELKQLINEELGVSEWVTIDQAKIDAHAETTGDADWLHNDPILAAKKSPFDGKTIAQGFMILSHLSMMSEEMLPCPDDTEYVLNYGLNRVRFLNPVIVGDRIRCRMVLKDVIEKESGYLVITENTIETEGTEKKALIAEWLGMAVKA